MNSGALSLCVFPLVFFAEDLPERMTANRAGAQKASRHRSPICDHFLARAGGTSQPREKLKVDGVRQLHEGEDRVLRGYRLMSSEQDQKRNGKARNKSPQGHSEKPSARPMQPSDAARRETQVALQDQAPNDSNKTSDFIAYPINKVVGFIDDLGDVKAALGDLKAAGFKTKDIQVLTGEKGAHRIDASGDEHGELAHILRSIQKTLGDYEIPRAKRHEQELLARHFGIGVIAKDEEDRNKVRDILRSHNGHFVNFYGRWVMEPWNPNEVPERPRLLPRTV